MALRFRVFFSAFCTGVVSLLLELSLLREFVYVIGSTAFTNSLIISIFLLGLTAGAYCGAGATAGNRDKARLRFSGIQACILLFLMTFYVSKDGFIYFCPQLSWVVAYFALCALVPSFLAGLAYAATVDILFEGGPGDVARIYAWSTLGSVAGGLSHGFVFVYFLGLHAAYLFAAACTTLAVLSMHPSGPEGSRRGKAFLASALAAAWLIQSNVVNAAFYRFNNRVYHKSSPAGLVEVWQLDRKGAVKMLVHNVHQYYSFEWDNQAHAQWAEATLEIVGRPAAVLLLGYGSGISTATYLRSEQAVRVDTVENSLPVLEAGKRFFPAEYELSVSSSRSRILIEDFRKYIRFTDRRYDIILLDHNVIDPYFAGFFTVEFFAQLKKILNPRGVIALYGAGMSWDTTQASFPYIYRNVDPSASPIIRENGLFLSLTPFDARLDPQYRRAAASEGGTPVFSDHSIKGMHFRGALGMILFHMNNMMKPRELFWVNALKEPFDA